MYDSTVTTTKLFVIDPRFCGWPVVGPDGTLVICVDPQYTPETPGFQFELVDAAAQPPAPQRAWQGPAYVVLAPLRNGLLASLGLLDWNTSTGPLDIMDRSGAVLSQISVLSNEVLLRHVDGNVWVHDRGSITGGTATHVRRFGNDGTALGTTVVPCTFNAETGTGPWWFALDCYVPTTIETTTGPVVVDDEPRSYLISQDELGGIVTRIVEVSRGYGSFLSDVHVVDDVVVVLATLDVGNVLHAAPNAVFNSGSKAWVGYRVP
jgi:hypothetical protein